MESDPSLEQTARRIVQWAAENPLSAEEAERRYASLLSGLPSLRAAQPEWKLFKLGRQAMRYWRDRVEDWQQSLEPLSPAFALRGAAAAEVRAPECILKQVGLTADACVKLSENADHATLALALWLEPKAKDAPLPFRVTVTGPNGTVVAGPVACAAGSVLRFDPVTPESEYTLTFSTEGETWHIRWGLASEAG
ncbi:MAG TPA: hypothetical protein VGL42_06845 [Opitutaceae bacterium]|jgi:hypothetical protein